MSQPPPSTIAIDGPVASGKSSVGRELARRFGYVFLDTGTMYRALAWWALQSDVSPADPPALQALIAETRIEVDPEPDGTHVKVNGQDATPYLREPQVEQVVSLVSAVPAVREAMVREQRRVAAGQPVVMAGRDIGTVVLPDAELKVYLDASVENRAARRMAELPPGGITLEQVTEALRERDRLDTERELSPLKPADDAIIIDTNDLTLIEVVESIARLAAGDCTGAPSAGPAQ